MADSNSGPLAAVNSLVNGAVGIVKQVLGIVLNRDSLQEEGKAQQDKAEAQKDVAKKEAEPRRPAPRRRLRRLERRLLATARSHVSRGRTRKGCGPCFVFSPCEKTWLPRLDSNQQPFG